MTDHLCPACRTTPRRSAQYLCPGCWFTLPTATRKALNRRDEHAHRRLQRLLEALTNHIPLRDITIRNG